MNKTGAFFLGFGAGAVFILVLGAVATAVLGFFFWQSIAPVPMGQVTNDPREAALESDLVTIQSQLELYKVQHLEMYPSQLPSVGTDGKKFVEQLTRRTNAEGKFSKSMQNAPFGPYLEQMPANSFALGDGSVKIGKAPCPGDGSSDWYFCTESNKFSPNDARHKDK